MYSLTFCLRLAMVAQEALERARDTSAFVLEQGRDGWTYGYVVLAEDCDLISTQ